ncbi:MAG: helix-turn-helix domain-containing protein [Turicibacter sp.]|nr:helix-turn-helix domain-containing protein [Turicibacter sp.]
MIGKLKELYKDKCVIDEMPKYPNDYYWFQTEDRHLIGISKTVGLAEKRLLSVMLDEIVAVDFDHQTRLLWLDFLNGNDAILEKISQKRLKFIFFNHQFEAEGKADFEHLIKEFNENCLTLYLDRHYGVILDFNESTEDGELEAFVEAARQDFYYGFTFYETASYDVGAGLCTVFQEELELFKSHHNKSRLVMKRQDLLLESLCQDVSNDRRYEGFKACIQKEMPQDVLKVVTAYFENGFNLSLAAKGLHMHRNTFMNKLDKFIAATGLNVKDFGQAVVAYLLIEGMKTKHLE